MSTIYVLIIAAIILLSITWSVCIYIGGKWKSFENMKKNFEAMEDDCKKIKNQLNEYDAQIKRAEGQRAESEKELANIRAELKDQAAKKEEYDRVQKFLVEHKQILAERDSLDQGIIDATKKLSVLMSQMDEKKSEYQQVETKLKEIKKVLESESLRKEEYDRVQKFLAEHKQILAERDSLDQGIIDATKKLSVLMSQMDEKKSEYQQVETKLKEIKKVLESESLRKEEYERICKYVSEHQSIVAERDALEKEIRKMTDELNQQLNQLEKKKKELDEFESKIKEAKNVMEANKEKLLLLNSIDERIKMKEKELSELTASVGRVMEQVKSGLDRLERMNLTGVQTLRHESFEELKEPAFSIKEEGRKENSHHDEQEAIKSVRNHLKESGFNVPDRLLYAFHTSLKASEMSSLTVMAGVSGTGKSALPKLYAEAMGIFFQPLAVEPRWDSPKDLLGFFNYVTNHYEPTMLARAFLQFQGVHPSGSGKNFGPKKDLSEYMFMPLLDEMNLARIEYYFSEFLSKLEMRRLQGDLTYDNWKPVSLELFQGFDGNDANGKDVSESPIRLFANTNTLFVGTMNEDETTQSLSDKVIDRANVLYFGRPAKLEASGATMRGVNVVSRGYLPKATWQSWVKPISDVSEDSGVQEKLTNLNKALAGLNRPFAHRTYQAILSYVANYPEDDRIDDRLNRALADQIGMRIMPKLRGLDLRQNQEVFDSVGRIVAELSDTQLSRAFNDARDLDKNHSGFFQWTGFDWSQDENA